MSRRLSSIVVPCWNNLRYTRACVESVRRCTAPGSYELIVVDNGSTDGTPRYLERLDGARVIRNRRNLGFGAAINQGMRAARGESVVWLNNDTVVTPGWLDRLTACLKRPRAGAAGPLTNTDFPKSGGRERPDRLAAALALRHKGKARPMHWLLGFCLALEREAVERVGLVDERFGPGLYEDYDYCLRLRQAGYDLLLAEDAYVFHHWHKSGTSDRARIKRNRDLFIDKWCRNSLLFLDTLGEKPQTAQSLSRPLL